MTGENKLNPIRRSLQKLAVITSYTSSRHNDIRNQNAIALYAKKTITPLARTIPIDLYAESLPGRASTPYVKNLRIIRSWVRDNPLSLLKTAWKIACDTQVDVVLIQFEFTMFGRMGALAVFPLVVAVLRAAGKHIVWEQHEVVLDVSKLEQHIHITNKVVQKIYNAGFTTYYYIIGLFTSYIIVLENSLKSRLARVVSPDKIVHISHIAESDTAVSKASAVSKLKLDAKTFYVMAFGFINWYKGSDWIADAYIRNPIQGTKLILAGGMSPTMSETTEYGDYFRTLSQRVRKTKNIKITGYVPDRNVSAYFAASDLIVLPYRYLFAASGPLSLALAYGKPFILSSKLRGYMNSADFVECMRASEVDPEDLFFDLEGQDFTKKVMKAKESQEYMRRLTRFSQLLRDRRSPAAVTRNYMKVLQAAATAQSMRFRIATA